MTTNSQSPLQSYLAASPRGKRPGYDELVELLQLGLALIPSRTEGKAPALPLLTRAEVLADDGRVVKKAQVSGIIQGDTPENRKTLKAWHSAKVKAPDGKGRIYKHAHIMAVGWSSRLQGPDEGVVYRLGVVDFDTKHWVDDAAYIARRDEQMQAMIAGLAVVQSTTSGGKHAAFIYPDGQILGSKGARGIGADVKLSTLADTPWADTARQWAETCTIRPIALYSGLAASIRDAGGLRPLSALPELEKALQPGSKKSRKQQVADALAAKTLDDICDRVAALAEGGRADGLFKLAASAKRFVRNDQQRDAVERRLNEAAAKMADPLDEADAAGHISNGLEAKSVKQADIRRARLVAAYPNAPVDLLTWTRDRQEFEDDADGNRMPVPQSPVDNFVDFFANVKGYTNKFAKTPDKGALAVKIEDDRMQVLEVDPDIDQAVRDVILAIKDGEFLKPSAENNGAANAIRALVARRDFRAGWTQDLVNSPYLIDKAGIVIGPDGKQVEKPTFEHATCRRVNAYFRPELGYKNGLYYKQALNAIRVDDPVESAERVDWFGRALMGCVNRDHAARTLVALVGPPGTGKSTAINAPLEVLGGDIACAIASDIFTAGYRGDLDRALSPIEGKALISLGDFAAGKGLDAEKLKPVTGNDYITGRKLWEEVRQFKANAVAVLSQNGRLELTGEELATSTGGGERTRVIECTNEVTGGDRDPQLGAKLSTEDEKSMTLNWLIERLVDRLQPPIIKEDEFPDYERIPASVRTSTDQALEDAAKPVTIFYKNYFKKERGRGEGGPKYKCAEMHLRFTYWLFNSGQARSRNEAERMALNSHQFRKALQSLSVGCVRADKHGRLWLVGHDYNPGMDHNKPEGWDADTARDATPAYNDGRTGRDAEPEAFGIAAGVKQAFAVGGVSDAELDELAARDRGE